MLRIDAVAHQAIVLVLAVGVAACSAATGPSDGSVDTGPTSGPCPAVLPTAGGTCPRLNLVCGYGDNPRVECRPNATCTASGWTVAPAPCPAPAACPDLGDAAAGQRCTTMNATCGTARLFCTCTNCGPPYPVQMCSGDPTWHCSPAPATGSAGCPAEYPNLGTACAPENQTCSYSCEGNLTLACQGGVWVSMRGENMCPISSRRAKRSIEYVGEGELDRLAHAALTTRLATYEYVAGPHAGPRRLGFIIEDQPTSLAVAADGAHVDLYGYTSLLYAAVQSQERRIAQLGADIAAMRHALIARDTRALRRRTLDPDSRR